MVDGVLETIERITGRRPPTCPWWAFAEPVVQDCIEAHRWFESGQVATKLGHDPPYYLIQGIEIHEQALAAMRAEERQRRAEERRRERGNRKNRV